MKFKEPFNGFSHLIGALLSIVGLVLLMYYSITLGTPVHIASFAIYGASLILLYSASAIYHLLTVSKKATKILRYIDHMMIYILIAGTYTPICTLALPDILGKVLLICIWTIAVIGIITTRLWLNAPRWLSTLIYVLMGWFAIIAIPPLINSVSLSGFGWLLAGGIIYSVGAIIYGTKWPNLSSKVLGFHEIFHLFILAGSFCHFWLMFKYVLPLGQV